MGSLFLLGLFGVLVLGILMWAGSAYNTLVALKNRVDQAWAGIDLILKQRFDEIPQLIEVLEQTVKYEKSVIEKVMEARSRYGSASNEGQKVKASQELSVALAGVLAIGEAYPDLKSNANFGQLMTRLSGLEGRLSDKREAYNDVVTNWNTHISQFPNVFVAVILSYRERSLFEVSESEKRRPSLKMNLGV